MKALSQRNILTPLHLPSIELKRFRDVKNSFFYWQPFSGLVNSCGYDIVSFVSQDVLQD